jgi:enoyl-CoA hydratase/carnithine racemase
MSGDYATIRYETTADLVATITLDRPDALNAFDREMCEEIRSAWQRIKGDPAVNAVVLRAAGDRAFCAGLDVKKAYGQPDDIWNHEDPGELLSPKWQKVWKPVVCAVQGMCTAGAFYFLNEADVVICSEDATFFDSHVSHGMVSALEPVGLMRRIGLGETLRIALSGNDERVSAATALRIGLVSEIVQRDQPGRGARDRGRHREWPTPPRRARSVRSGSRSTGRTAPRWTRACSIRGSGTRSAWPR